MPSEDAVNPTKPATNPIITRPFKTSGTIIINVPENPKKIPNHWNLDKVSFKKILASIDVKIGCNETNRAIRLTDISLESAKKTPPKYRPWNSKPLIVASLKAFKVTFLFVEKNIKNKKKKIATIPNLIEREKKGVALSTIILLVIKAEDQRTTKINGIILRIIFSLIWRS